MHTNNRTKRNRNKGQRNMKEIVPSSVFSAKYIPRLPVANRAPVCLRYKDTFTQTMTPGLGANYQFRMNALNDPDYTGTGHQPYRYDQYTPGTYTRYRIYVCHWKVTYTSGGSTYYCTVCPTNGDLAVAVTGAATFNAVGELPFADSKALGTGGTPNAIFQGTMNLNELGGYTRAEYSGDDRFQAQYNANPVEVFLLNCCHYWPSVLGTQDVHFMVELCYEGELLDPPIVAQS